MEDAPRSRARPAEANFLIAPAPQRDACWVAVYVPQASALETLGDDSGRVVPSADLRSFGPDKCVLGCDNDWVLGPGQVVWVFFFSVEECCFQAFAVS